MIFNWIKRENKWLCNLKGVDLIIEKENNIYKESIWIYDIMFKDKSKLLASSSKKLSYAKWHCEEAYLNHARGIFKTLELDLQDQIQNMYNKYND